MRIFYTNDELTAYIDACKSKGKSIGFTPTMGALHDGHFSLIGRSLEDNEVSICSIFVNPTQFDHADDLAHYPRTLNADCDALSKIGCDAVYAPTIDEVYPGGEENYRLDIDLKGLDERMEGAFRPGHFAGVVQVVKRLLDIVRCDYLYMGQKDFQQHTIIRYMIDTLQIPVVLVVCPTLREDNGLARSSRNERLTPYQREKAAIIHRVLIQAKKWIRFKTIAEIESTAMKYMDIHGFEPEYFNIVDTRTLMPADQTTPDQYLVACAAVWAGDVRLIDNILL